ncbi:MAG: Thiol:disulfide interchange protein DsbD [Burkholderiaceae bacterium]|nr:Thiol:disulfide interchange protein DsbD [Burkholderiaceae bacterium]
MPTQVAAIADRALAAAHRVALAACVALSLAGAARAAVDGVAWQPAANNADIERAFVQARASDKPVLLYWGAKWCPPCNQLKATLFNRHDFIERSRSLVAVEIDGDLPGAQKLGSRFKVSGYPTMVLLRSDGTEIVRLPGEADPPQVLRLLEFGLAGGRAAKDVLADARAGKPLPGAEWRMLAFYSWISDESQLLPAAERPGVLAGLSAACPSGEAASATRLMLKALADSDDGKGVKPDAALRQRVRSWLADPSIARAQMDVLTNFAVEITKALSTPGTADRRAIVGAFDVALQRLQVDATLSRADRLTALGARVDLARIDQPKAERHPRMPALLRKQVRDASAAADREVTDGYERQAVITAAAYILGQAGLWPDSDALLKANLAKSHSPFYLMSQLAGNARKLGRNDEALRWYEQAFVRSEGPATRLQWGAQYVSALVELAPSDESRLEHAVSGMIDQAALDPGAFDGRSARSLARVDQQLAKWNRDGRHDAAIARLRVRLEPVCVKLDGAAERAACGRTFQPPGKSST